MGWIAVDQDGLVALYTTKPIRHYYDEERHLGYWGGTSESPVVWEELAPEVAWEKCLTWSSEPLEVADDVNTCNNCCIGDCEYRDDPYNKNGDCLAEK